MCKWCITLSVRKVFWPRNIKRAFLLYEQKAQGKCLILCHVLGHPRQYTVFNRKALICFTPLNCQIAG